MTSNKKLIIAAAILGVLAIPTMAWAFNGPIGADPQVPSIGERPAGEGSLGWMGQMHDYMWNNGQLPEDFPTDAGDWMNQMHDYMWNDGQLPEDFPAGPCPMGAGTWGGR